MHSRSPSESIASELTRHCDIVRRASAFLAKEADSDAPERAELARLIGLLGDQSAAAKQVILQNGPRAAFFDPEPEQSVGLASALHELIEAITGCARLLAADVPGPGRELAAIACNLILQCVSRLHESLKYGHPHAGSSPRHVPDSWPTVHALETEIARIVRRDFPRTCNEAADSAESIKLAQIARSLDTVANRCRYATGLRERIRSGTEKTESAVPVGGNREP